MTSSEVVELLTAQGARAPYRRAHNRRRPRGLLVLAVLWGPRAVAQACAWLPEGDQRHGSMALRDRPHRRRRGVAGFQDELEIHRGSKRMSAALARSRRCRRAPAAPSLHYAGGADEALCRLNSRLRLGFSEPAAVPRRLRLSLPRRLQDDVARHDEYRIHGLRVRGPRAFPLLHGGSERQRPAHPQQHSSGQKPGLSGRADSDPDRTDRPCDPVRRPGDADRHGAD